MPGSGTFNDGQTARRHAVALDIIGKELTISDAAGAMLALWPLDEIRIAHKDAAGGEVRLMRVGKPARLTVDGDALWLTGRCPKLRSRHGTGGFSWRHWAAIGTLAVLSLAGIFVFLIPAAANWAISLIPTQAEEKLGKTTRGQIVAVLGRMSKNKTDPLCRDPEGEKLLTRAADELSAAMESPFKIRMTVVRFDVPNAITLPGGEVMIFSGLIDKAKSGDELAGVIAHEIAHVVRRDPLHVAVKRAGAAAMISLLIGDVTGGVVLSGLVTGYIEGGYSRDAERAADILAVTALNRLNRTSRPLADFLERITREQPLADKIPSFLATHPSTESRGEEIRALGQGHGRAFLPHEWDVIRHMCR